MLLLVIRTNDTIYNKLQESILMGINKNKRILRHLRLQSFQKSYYPTDDHVRPFYGQSWNQVFRMPETRSTAKEYLKVYTEQFLFWKKCDLNHYPWFRQAVYKIDEIYMDVHKIVDNEDVFWLLDGLDRRSQNHEIVDAVNKLLVKRLSQSVHETRLIFEEAVNKDHSLQECKENRKNYYRLVEIEHLVRKNGIELPGLTKEFKESSLHLPDRVNSLIKVGRYVRPSFFVQITTSNYVLEAHEKYSTYRESDHNKDFTRDIIAKIESKKDVISSSKKEVNQLRKDLHEAKKIISNLTSGAYRDKYSREEADDLLSSSKNKVVSMTARLKQLCDIIKCTQGEVNELEKEIY